MLEPFVLPVISLPFLSWLSSLYLSRVPRMLLARFDPKLWPEFPYALLSKIIIFASPVCWISIRDLRVVVKFWSKSIHECMKGSFMLDYRSTHMYEHWRLVHTHCGTATPTNKLTQMKYNNIHKYNNIKIYIYLLKYECHLCVYKTDTSNNY